MKYFQFAIHIFLSLLLSAAPLAVAHSEDQVENTAITDVVEYNVNINTASAEEMATLLKGIGAKKAQAIIDFREQNGPFTNVSDIVQVKGIGPGFLEKNKSHLTVE